MARDAIYLADEPFTLRLVTQAMSMDIDAVEWFEHGLCLKLDGARWFPDRSTPKTEIIETRRVCRRCPVRAECLGYALIVGDWHGIWGGFTGDERREILRQWRRLVRAGAV